MKPSVKRYFQRKGTVSIWWDPEKRDTLFRSEILRQTEIINALLKLEGLTILDVAAGKGRLSISAATLGCRYMVAIDISLEMLLEARQRARNMGVQEVVEFVLMDGERLAFRNDSFDLVACLEALVHMPDVYAAIKEFSRVLKVGSFVVVTTTVPINLLYWFRYIERVNSWLRLKEWLITPIYSSTFYRERLRRWLRRPEPYGRDIHDSVLIHAFRTVGLGLVRRIPLDSQKHPRMVLLVGRKDSF